MTAACSAITDAIAQMSRDDLVEIQRPDRMPL
jgi:hypothetical protein